MANRNTATGGITAFTTEHPTYQDINDTIAATTYERKASNTTPVTVTNSGTGTATGTFTISVPAGVVNKYVEIKAHISATSGLNPSSSSTVTSTTYKLYKTYSAVDTDLITTKTASSAYEYNAGDNDVDEIFINYYYEPTTLEKTNGFDVKIYMTAYKNVAGGGGSTIIVNYAYIMGI